MDYNLFNAALKISAFLITLIPLIYTLTQTHWTKLQHIAFLTMIISALGESLFGTIREFLSISLTLQDGTFHLYVIEYIFLLFHTSFQVAYSFYVVVSSGHLSKSNRKYIFFFWLPLIFMYGMFALNQVNHNHVFFEFVWNESTASYQLIQHLPYHILWIYTAAYAIFSIIIFSRNIRGIKWRKISALCVITFIILAGIVFDLIFKQFRIKIFAQSIAVTSMLVWLENEDQYIHKGTGLYNRLAFVEDNSTLLGAGQKYKLFCITLLNHDYIRRAYDEDVRKRVCDRAAEIIRGHVKRSMPYYLSNGKYAFYYFDKDDIKEKLFTEKLRDDLNHSFEILPGLVIETNWQITIAKIPEDIDTVQGLDDLFEGEPTGKGVIIKRTGSDIKGIKRRNEILGAFERGLKNDNFEVYYQPIYDTKSDKIIAGEALLRLTDPLLGRISPAEFIPIAEASGHIKTLGELVFNKTIKFQKENNFKELGLGSIAINVSIKQLLRQDLASYFIKTAKELEIDPSQIILEITESEDASKSDFFNNQFHALREAGFRLSLDDYGTGYSNLAKVINYDFYVIKMDISLLRNAADKKGKALLQNCIKGMRSYGFSVTQEGVETKEQLKEVIVYGAQYIQGFFISPPLPGDEFVKFVKNFKGVESLG